MATGADVLGMLLPDGGWVINGDSWDGVEFFEAQPITKEAFEAGFAQFDAWKAEQKAAAVAAKEAAIAKLVALGLDLDDLKSLGF